MSDLLETREGDVVRLTLNRPERLNALSSAMTQALRGSLSRIAEDATVGAVILTGAGRGFCAGGDISAMERRHGVSVDQRARGLRENAEISRLLAEMPQVTIAAVNGVAAGAGLALALACDFRLFGATGRFGTARAKELFLLPEILEAPAALDLGLATRIVPDAALSEEALALAQSLAAGPRGAQAVLKQLLAADEPLATWLDREAQAQAHCATSADHREAVAAFMEKRAPVFGSTRVHDLMP